ncbi:hypothetical protein CRUP_032029 [Coryphaenoides rupestris]|nr:hypothetical protein CRUP_032029 [Coryphaenoides rupestris]
MNVRRDEYLLDHGDGLKSTGVRPNGDGTHQIKMWVKIPKNDDARYTCEVIHKGSGFSLTEEWDHKTKGPDTGGEAGGTGVGLGVVVGVVGGVVALLAVLGPVTWLVIRHFRNKGSNKSDSGNN